MTNGVACDRNLAWDGCVNVRDLGGLGDMTPGAVIRMDEPTTLTEAGWAAAWEHGVRTIVDLRDPCERTSDRAHRPDGIATVPVPVEPVGTPFHDRWQRIDGLASPLHYTAMLDEHPHAVVAAVRAVATAAPGGVAIHCAAGKDRTGLVTLVLLAFAGATADEICADYLLSYGRLQPRFDAENPGEGVRDQLTAVTGLLADHGTTIEESIAATVAHLRMPDFLLEGGLPKSGLAALRRRLTG
ncbi:MULTISPECIES: tyrosine-protein phosphatase [Prauserella salsuginis group]|uniref:Tyrosine-protein phosphatase n=2 Tax=Prauserella salsuginis TaxID=387889 RepID=A0ABW6FXM9_9PSEU|nr:MULTISPECIES: tyrosine-protein phosphatase [Prauserella salsuginis group]MCR3721023.1 Protein tyrosine/serine phosphatase [Prauserella flava]MCR3734896.1 Protein tyrosine/serine phosphatase [Prauserella salsuginis]